MKPLYIKPGEKQKGLSIYCGRCNTNVYETCRQTGQSIKTCAFPNLHKFKLYYPDPQRPGKRLTKTFTSRDLKEVKQQAMTIIHQSNANANPSAPAVAATNSKSQLLVQHMAQYLTHVSGAESVPLHLRKQRSKAYVKSIQSCFKFLLAFAKSIGNDPKSMTLDKIDHNFVGRYYQHLHEAKGYSPRSINKAISFLRTFFKFLEEFQGIQLTNPFRFVVKKRVVPSPQVISPEEFEALLSIVSPENGRYTSKCKGKKLSKNAYRPYLVDGFKLFAFTGRRREEVLSMRFSDISCDEAGNPVVITCSDLKVNHIKGIGVGEQGKTVHVPVTAELRELLSQLGFEKFKNQNRFLIAPEVKEGHRKHLIDTFSRGFTHYYKQLGTGRELGLKSLRKTYITSLAIRMGGGDQVRQVSGHSTSEVLKHYINEMEVAKSLRDFSVFGSKENSRLSELDGLRQREAAQHKSIEK